MKSEKGQVLSLAALTWPIFIEQVLLKLIGSADIVMLSRYSDAAAAAVGVTNQIVLFTSVLFSVISTGAVVVHSQYTGAGRHNQLKHITSTAIICSFAIGLLISIVFILFYEPMLSGMDLYDNVREYAHIFARLVGGFIFLRGLTITINGLLRSYGYAKDPLYTNIIVNIINIIGNYIALFVLDSGVFGVAVATVISTILWTILTIIILYKRVGNPFLLAGIKKRTAFYGKKILGIGIPGAGESMSYSGYQLVLTNVITTMGGVALVTRVYTRTLNVFMFLFTVALSQAGAIIIGNLKGAGKIDELYKLCLKNVKIGMAVSLSLAGFFYIFSEPLLSIFSDNPEVITMGSQVFLVYFFVEAGRVLNMVIITSLRAVGDVKFAVYYGIFNMWVIGFGMSFFFGVVMGMGLVGVVIGTALDECIRGIVMLFRWKSKVWQKNKLI